MVDIIGRVLVAYLGARFARRFFLDMADRVAPHLDEERV